MDDGARVRTWLLALLTLLVVVFLFLPPTYLLLVSFEPSELVRLPRTFNDFSLKWYRELFRQYRLPGALEQSLKVGGLTALFTAVLSLLAGLAYRKLRRKSYFLGFLIFPIFVPGVIAALSLSVFFKLIFLRSSMWTIVFGHTLYALPFGVIVTLVSFSRLSEGTIEAARDLGASGFHAFKDVIFPMTRGGIFGAALFGFLLSLNEFIRAFYLSGWKGTLPVYMYGQMKGGADPSIYALAGLILIISFVLILVALLYYSVNR